MRRMGVPGAMAAMAATVAAEDVAPAMGAFQDGAVAERPARRSRLRRGHREQGDGAARHAIGPPNRRTEAELRRIVANVRMIVDGAFMPAPFKTTGVIRPGAAYADKAPTEELRPFPCAQQIEDVAAFLLAMEDRRRTRARIERSTR